MNQKGGITLDFIFALVLVLSMTLLLGVFSFSLAIVEGVQYIAFASSRAYYPSHINVETQRRLAQEKFEELTKSSGFSGFIKPDLFQVTVEGIGDASQVHRREDFRDILEGVRLKVVISMLNINIPGLGGSSDEPYETFINSYLGRESTAQECQAFMQQRFQALLEEPGYSSSVIQPQSYFAFEDNGC